jgi:hypothetical protein
LNQRVFSYLWAGEAQPVVEEAPEPEELTDDGLGIGAIIAICIAIVVAIGGVGAGGIALQYFMR